ncbi:hypothetical protein GO986_08500 [Deinococcus sp. HMF7620]|uniref:Uncharacterized protein n=1 Tax=Deinococcus arboris TaxID=2682977 RepID=A0A7C9LQR7_9DEIO|nr:hypothetical protein [Deinococcus arboris]MVN86801.1 hypothetical protein [Deinococcus arboris]
MVHLRTWHHLARNRLLIVTGAASNDQDYLDLVSACAQAGECEITVGTQLGRMTGRLTQMSPAWLSTAYFQGYLIFA